MAAKRVFPEDPLNFIRECVNERKILWTYHVNMRMVARCITREMVLESVTDYEIIESYPEDKYLPSYLVLARYGNMLFHILVATDVSNENVRIVTTYHPDPQLWSEDFKRRKNP